MSGATQPQYPEKRTWVNPSFSSQWMTKRLVKNPKGATQFTLEAFFSVDDTPDFHDPYSEISLFLSQKIKSEMHAQGWIKKWTIKIQEALLEKVAPEFRKKFPQYRLGIAALRKTWEKISYYTNQMEDQKEAIGNDGQLNIPYLIRENLRQYPQLATISGFHPYQYAHQLALKISECIAVIDGIKPPMDHLSRIIWAMQKHLLSWESLQAAKSPHDEYDQLDKIIVKMVLEITASHPLISASLLELKLQESLELFSEMPVLHMDNLEGLKISSSKHFTESQHLLETFPYRIGQRIQNELAAQLIDDPNQHFGSLVYQTLLAFQKHKEILLSKSTAEIRRRIYFWCQQGDLLCRCVRFDKDLPILQKILKFFSELEILGMHFSSKELVDKISSDYLQEYPFLCSYSIQLRQRITTLYKYAWYTLTSDSEETSVERYLKWHEREAYTILEQDQRQILWKRFQESLPLIPFERNSK